MDIDSSKNYARQAAAVPKRTHDTEIPPLRRTVGMNFFMQLKVFVREKGSSGTERGCKADATKQIITRAGTA